MKKIIAVMAVILCLCSCGNEVSYITKYISEPTHTELRKKPEFGAEIICVLDEGEAVSFECDSKNGYSKVVYNGTTGYVMSKVLSVNRPEKEEKPDVSHEIKENKKEPDILYETEKEAPESDLLTDEEVENYIVSFIRPMYYYINDNLESYEKKSSDEAALWYDSNGCVKKEYLPGAKGRDFSRQYYYDSNTGKMIFAFMFTGEEEYRLYFKNDRLIRYIDEDDNIYDNPASGTGKNLSEVALLEAY